MINVLICGICGKMGATVLELINSESGIKAVCGVDIFEAENFKIPVYKTFEKVKERVDVIIDFSSPTVLFDELDWAVKNEIPVVLGTTGFNEKQLKFIDGCAKEIAIFKTANFSYGLNLLMKLVRKSAEVLGDKFDIEIVEKHHRLKSDAPSGTALMLADSVNIENRPLLFGREKDAGKRKGEIALHSVRGGTVVGEHEVMFFGEDEIITLSHSARSKKVFASGAIKAALFLAEAPAGKYGMEDML